ncbi:MAG: M6 family metalloprotease domain-containing protein [Prevotella sp.]|nr:M6 family metalloprotease domain-containing protein [Prevotella sp.]
MKRYAFTIWLMLTTALVMALPARRGLWRFLPMPDGRQVKAQLMGDERLHYWMTADSICYIEQDGQFVKTEMKTLRGMLRTDSRKTRTKRMPKTATTSTTTHRALIILANFTDTKFLESHTQALYNQIANAENYSNDEGFEGSVRDYFRDMSNGQLTLDFDVLGPIQLEHGYAYYGANSDDSRDVAVGEMILEALEAVKDQTDFAQYDWDGDGEVEQVVVIYAGEGEALGGTASTIWQQEWNLQDAAGAVFEHESTIVNTFACTSELVEQRLAGIGPFCHEFAHGLGLPDLYNMDQADYGMGSWSLMDQGVYNGDGRGLCPCALTSMERMVCGWLTPEEIAEPTDVSGMKALEDGGGAYLLRNDNYDNEFYLLENRQPIRWDKELPGNGLLVLHVDYSEAAWVLNNVNTSQKNRCTIVHAGNPSRLVDDNGFLAYDESTDPYPYNGNNTLSASSSPAAELYHKNLDGTFYLPLAITQINVDSNGNVSFSVVDADDIDPIDPNPTDAVALKETFDKTNGVGGNDNLFSGNKAGRSGTIVYDVEGWENINAYPANKCLKMGTGSKDGILETPQFKINGQYVLSFKAAPWADESSYMIWEIVGESDITIDEPVSTSMKCNQWNNYRVNLEGSGKIRLAIYSNNHRFFIDEVSVVSADIADSSPTAISEMPSTTPSPTVFAIDGRRLSLPFSSLPRGIYIVNGRKIVK